MQRSDGPVAFEQIMTGTVKMVITADHQFTTKSNFHRGKHLIRRMIRRNRALIKLLQNRWSSPHIYLLEENRTSPENTEGNIETSVRPRRICCQRHNLWIQSKHSSSRVSSGQSQWIPVAYKAVVLEDEASRSSITAKPVHLGVLNGPCRGITVSYKTTG